MSNLLNVVDIELVIILKHNYMYPSNREEFFSCIKELDNNDSYKERILSKSHLVYRNIYDFYSNIEDQKLKTILDNII